MSWKQVAALAASMQIASAGAAFAVFLIVDNAVVPLEKLAAYLTERWHS